MTARVAQLVDHIQHLAAAADSASDGDLLARFVHQGDESAFAVLVARYGPMVRLAAGRMLTDAGDVEDCLQATFLVLARKAASLRRPDALAGFLHSVACRTAGRTDGPPVAAAACPIRSKRLKHERIAGPIRWRS